MSWRRAVKAGGRASAKARRQESARPSGDEGSRRGHSEGRGGEGLGNGQVWVRPWVPLRTMASLGASMGGFEPGCAMFKLWLPCARTASGSMGGRGRWPQGGFQVELAGFADRVGVGCEGQSGIRRRPALPAGAGGRPDSL